MRVNNQYFKIVRFQVWIVRWEGVEPSRPSGHMALNHACLPVPAPAPEQPYYNQGVVNVKLFSCQIFKRFFA